MLGAASEQWNPNWGLGQAVTTWSTAGMSWTAPAVRRSRSSTAQSCAPPVGRGRSHRERRAGLLAARIARCWRIGCTMDRVRTGQEAGVIRKLKSGEYRLYSRKKDPRTGKRRNLGTFRTREEAQRHERAVQFFKRRGG
jgi:hypothetical protein